VWIEEQDGTERLNLSRGCNLALHGEVGQEGGDLRFCYVLQVPLAMEQDVLPDPLDIALLGSETVVFETHGVPHLIQQFGWLGIAHTHVMW
jgi:hypothetical protein